MWSFLRFRLDDCKFRSLGSQTEARGFSAVSDPASAQLGFTSGQICAVRRPKAFWRNSLIPIYTLAAKLFLLPTRKTGPAREDTEEMSAQVKDCAIRTHCSGSWVLSAWVGNPIRCVPAHLCIMLCLHFKVSNNNKKFFLSFLLWLIFIRGGSQFVSTFNFLTGQTGSQKSSLTSWSPVVSIQCVSNRLLYHLPPTAS